MILLLACSCSGVVPLLRGVLREAGHSGWLDYPVYQGKQEALKTLDQFPDFYKQLPEFGALRGSISNRSSFAVAIGYDKDTFRWADVAMGDLKSKLDAEVIVRDYTD